jgi:hypothetical protein
MNEYTVFLVHQRLIVWIHFATCITKTAAFFVRTPTLYRVDAKRGGCTPTGRRQCLRCQRFLSCQIAHLYFFKITVQNSLSLRFLCDHFHSLLLF